jgi:hypothetical protein
MGRLTPTTFVTSIIGIVICMGLGTALYKQGKGIGDIVSAVGSVASFFGLIIAILQIASVRQISEATNKAVRETRADLVSAVSISDLSKAIKLIEQIQTLLGNNKLELAHLRLQDLRTLLLQFGSNLQVERRSDYEQLLTKIGVHIVNLFSAIFKGKKVDVGIINQTLEAVIALLVTLENELKFKRGSYES